MPEYYVPVGIESIEPDMFPDVALYLRSAGKYVFYKIPATGTPWPPWKRS